MAVYRVDFKTLVLSKEEAWGIAQEMLLALKKGYGVVSVPFIRQEDSKENDSADAVYINITKD